MFDMQTLLRDLVAFESLTPNDAGCQAYLIDKLTQLGFTITRYDAPPVSNFYAQYGTKPPLLMFAGHTDVVPPGDSAAWHTPPFSLSTMNGHYVGRGVADMKGALVAMLLMAERLVSQPLKGSIGFLITSGEEGNDFDKGTPFVMKHLQQAGIKPQYCIVGEPSSHRQVGDTLKIGRRGSLSAQLILHGKQGHVAYPTLADNPIHHISPALHALTTLILDTGDDYFPSSSLQITEIHAGVGANNVIPGQIGLNLNVRFSPCQHEQGLKDKIMACFSAHDLTPDVVWRLNGEPFLTTQGKLLETCQRVIEKHLKSPPTLSTSGGTSDGRFIAPYGIEVLELGLCNTNIHQVNESIGLEDIDVLTTLYVQIGLALL